MNIMTTIAAPMAFTAAVLMPPMTYSPLVRSDVPFRQNSHSEAPITVKTSPSGTNTRNLSATKRKAPGSMESFNKRLDRLSKLTAGWNGVGSHPVPVASIALAHSFSTLIGEAVSKVHVVPNTSGDLVLEWSTGPTEVTAEILGGNRMRLTVDCEDPDVYVEQTVRALPSTLAQLFAGTK